VRRAQAWGVESCAGIFNDLSVMKGICFDLKTFQQCHPLIFKQQLLLFGKVARENSENLLRSLTFVGNTTQPATSFYVRRVGRPRNEWATMLSKESYKMSAEADRIIRNEEEWKRAVCQYCK